MIFLVKVLFAVLTCASVAQDTIINTQKHSMVSMALYWNNIISINLQNMKLMQYISVLNVRKDVKHAMVRALLLSSSLNYAS